MKPKVLNNVGDVFNELHYICKDKYNEEKDDLDTKSKKKFYYKKLRLTDDYHYESEEEEKEEKQQHVSKKLDKKESPNKCRFNEWVNRKETGINSEIFQKHFSFQRSSDMLKAVYTTNDQKKSNKLVNVIKSGLSDSKNEIKNMGEEEKQIEKPNEIINIVEEILEFNIQNQ